MTASTMALRSFFHGFPVIANSENVYNDSGKQLIITIADDNAKMLPSQRLLQKKEKEMKQRTETLECRIQRCHSAPIRPYRKAAVPAPSSKNTAPRIPTRIMEQQPAINKVADVPMRRSRRNGSQNSTSCSSAHTNILLKSKSMNHPTVSSSCGSAMKRNFCAPFLPRRFPDQEYSTERVLDEVLKIAASTPPPLPPPPPPAESPSEYSLSTPDCNNKNKKTSRKAPRRHCSFDEIDFFGSSSSSAATNTSPASSGSRATDASKAMNVLRSPVRVHRHSRWQSTKLALRGAACESLLASPPTPPTKKRSVHHIPSIPIRFGQ